MRRAPGVVERIHVRLRRQQPRHGPYVSPATFASARTGLKASVSHVRGAHSFQGGIDFRQAYATNTGGAGNSMGNFTFNSQYVQKNDDGLTPAGTLGLSYAAFMLGIPSSMSTRQQRELCADESLLRLVWAGYLARDQEPDAHSRAPRRVRTGSHGAIQPGAHLLRPDRSVADRGRRPGCLCRQPGAGTRRPAPLRSRAGRSTRASMAPRASPGRTN